MADNTIISKTDNFISDMIKASGIEINEEEITNSVYNLGNRFRLAKLMEKAKSGKELTLAFFGGSITAGASAGTLPLPESNIKTTFNTSDNTYLHWVCRWFKEMFACPVKMINAGIGATDTPYAVHRMNEDVLSYNPDLVILEWSVNDGAQFLYKQGTYEAMLRNFIKSDAAIIMLSLCTRTGDSSQALQEPIAKFYDIPMISYRDAFINNPKFEYFTNDSVHPNAVGHPLVGLLLCSYFQNIYINLDSAEKSDICVGADSLNSDATIYDGAYIAKLSDIYKNKVSGVRITDLGSFEFDEKTEWKFGFRKYLGFTARYAESYNPLIIEIDKCKTAFLMIYRNTVMLGSEFTVELNGINIESNTFTCMHGTDNNQPEWDYHWATERLCYFESGERVVIKITPKINPEHKDSVVRLFALLLS